LEMEHEKFKQERHGGKQKDDRLGHPAASLQGAMNCQIMRSCTEWSHGVALEHSIANVSTQSRPRLYEPSLTLAIGLH
jgi:hypothetical protein